MSEHDDEQTRADFDETVNMTATELRKWLDTDESKSVGQKPSGGGESTGHESGRHIVRILEKHKADRTDDDLAHMRRSSATSPGTRSSVLTATCTTPPGGTRS
ncbi:DUF3140 domain-containing protein [Curtobacterium sp. MCLR17_058]|uniref:DUF3140 domain-containing protein n=1 Tax=Curtobacterium sp. MCLR17_058 TaxID=2175635 RepID=UPI0032E7F995